MSRTCGEPSAYELRHSPEFADYHEPEPDPVEFEAEQSVGMEPDL